MAIKIYLDTKLAWFTKWLERNITAYTVEIDNGHIDFQPAARCGESELVPGQLFIDVICRTKEANDQAGETTLLAESRITFDLLEVGSSRIEVIADYPKNLGRMFQREVLSRFVEILERIGDAWPTAAQGIADYLATSGLAMLNKRGGEEPSWPGKVLLSDNVEVLPELAPDPDSTVIWLSKYGNDDADRLPIQWWGVSLLTNLDAPTMYFNLCRWLDGWDGKAFVIPVATEARWHLQANWILKLKSDDGMVYSASLRAFSVPISKGGNPPKTYEYSEGEADWAIRFLDVDVYRVSDSRCEVKLIGQTHAGKVLVNHTMNYLAKLYPDLLNKAPLPQATLQTQDERQKGIISLFNEGLTSWQIGERVGLSEARIKQIERELREKGLITYRRVRGQARLSN